MAGRARYVVPVDAKTIGRRLREIRNSRGLTQVEVAEKLRMKQALVSDYELGKLRLHGGLIVAFARVLKVSADEILGMKKSETNGFFKDRRFLRRLQKIDKLSRRDKQLLLGTIDKFLSQVS